MSPQLTTQQLEAQIRAFEARLKSKKLECDSLSALCAAAPPVIGRLFEGMLRDSEAPVSEAVENYLTAKIDWLKIDIQEYELTIKMLKSQQSGILLARPRG